VGLLAPLAVIPGVSARVASAATITVDTTSDVSLTACTVTPADCSLRGARSNANTNPGTDTIEFDVPGSGPHTIQPTSALPAGDVCQCGDLDEDGAVNAADVTIARQHLLGASIGVSYDLTRCYVIGPSDGGVSDCDVADIFVLERVVAGRPATVENTCQAAMAP
jgi:hypothetical protein